MRPPRGLLRVSATLAVLGLAAPAGATGFTDIGQDIKEHGDTLARVEGSFRVRGAMFYNLDLDRGPTPSGQLFFPVPLGDPKGQTMQGADLRLRTDLSFFAPGTAVAVKARLDAPDNLSLGSAPDGIPAASTTQVSPPNVVRLKRVYGEVLTPIGLLVAGRQGSSWGLGMLANGGDCADCNYGDAADRIAFVTPVAGHLWAVAFDFTAIGPYAPRQAKTMAVDVDPSVDVHTVTFAFLGYRDDLARERRRRAGKTTFDYGAYASYRWQNNDLPADYLPVASAIPLAAAQVTYRGYTASAFDLWARLTVPGGRIEAEGALLFANVDQASLIPGVLYRQPVTSRAGGAALESELGTPEDRFGVGLDLGYASGDPSPGFGVNPVVGAPAAQPGDLNGAKANPPYKNTVNNFTFHPDYFIDRILFREIIGSVSGAVYARPHVRYDLARFGVSRLTASLTAIASAAVYSVSAPGGKAPLGIELDPTLAYVARDGFSAALEHAVLFPLSGLDNVQLNLAAKPAQLLRLRLTYAF